MWSLQNILNSKKGSLSQTYKKNTEAKAKNYDLNQETTQTLESSAIMCAALERGEDLNKENSACDIFLPCDTFFAESQAVVEEFNVAPRNEERVR